MQATQAKLEIKSRIKAIFSHAERLERSKRNFVLYTENPHVIEGTLAATEKIDEGSLTARFVKRLLQAEQFTGTVALQQDQLDAQKKRAAALAKQRLLVLIKTIPASLHVLWAWVSQPRNTAIATLVGACLLSYKFIDSQARPEQQNAITVSAPARTNPTALHQSEPVAVAKTQSSIELKDTPPTANVTSSKPNPEVTKTVANEPTRLTNVPLPIPGLSLLTSGPSTAPIVVEPPAPTNNPQRSAKRQAQDSEDKSPTSIALKGELAEPIQNIPATVAPIIDQPVLSATPNKSSIETARWGDQSQLIAFSSKGLIAMVNGRPAEIAAGQALPNGEILKSIDRAQSLVVTDQRTIQLTE